MPTPITNKVEMYRRLNAGLLGNTLKTAETVEDAERLVAAGGAFAIRSKVSHSATRYHLPAEVAIEEVRKLPGGTWNLSPMLLDPGRVCYGHLLDGPGGWALHFTRSQRPAKLMESKDGCKQEWLNGLAARMYVRGIMDDVGWDTLLRLVDDYPDHVIEFTVMASARDAYGPSNTIFWEVRTTSGEYERGTWFAWDLATRG